MRSKLLEKYFHDHNLQLKVIHKCLCGEYSSNDNLHCSKCNLLAREDAEFSLIMDEFHVHTIVKAKFNINKRLLKVDYFLHFKEEYIKGFKCVE